MSAALYDGRVQFIGNYFLDPYFTVLDTWVPSLVRFCSKACGQKTRRQRFAETARFDHPPVAMAGRWSISAPVGRVGKAGSLVTSRGLKKGWGNASKWHSIV